jgi:hypothetical protein
MIQDIVLSETVVCIYMIDQIIKLDGSNKKILKDHKDKDGNE